MTKQELAYLAGIVDGEGTVNIAFIKTSGEYRARLYVVNTSYALIEWIKARFGGLVYKRISKNEKWKPKYEWVMPVSRKDTKLLKQLIPYLVIKKQQAGLVLELIATIGNPGRKLTQETIAKRKELFEKNKQLNSGSRND